MNMFQEAELLLSGLGVKDDNFIDEAIQVIKKYGSYKKALVKTIDMNYDTGVTKLLRLSKDEIKQDDIFAFECEGVFNSINKHIDDYTKALGRDFNKEVMEIYDFNKKGLLSVRMAWTLSFCGGREFIKNIRFFRDGEEVLRIIKAAIIKADKYIENDKTRIANPIKNLQIQRG